MNIIQRTGSIALLLALTPLAWAEQQPDDARRLYEQERARCVRGESHQDRATCLQEAGAAYEEARRGALAKPAAADLSENATERCDALPAADRAACVQRILGAGKTEGSVEGGGIIRETETKLPAQ